MTICDDLDEINLDGVEWSQDEVGWSWINHDEIW